MHSFKLIIVFCLYCTFDVAISFLLKYPSKEISPKPCTLNASGKNKSLKERLSAEENMIRVANCIEISKDIISDGLKNKGYALIDNFLGQEVCSIYRDEAEGYLKRGEMFVSQSTRWDKQSESVIVYDKNNVLSIQLLGGEGYQKAPRLHEYIVSMIKAIVPVVNKSFPTAKLSPTLASNKLAVCLGNGSCYDKHFDNSGANDLRKLTVLLYLNPDWRNNLGGCFRMYMADKYIEQDKDQYSVDESGYHFKDIEPINDRLLVFWADQNIHSVQPSWVFDSPKDNRYALTVWLTTTSIDSIEQDELEIKKHFPY